MPPSYTTGEAGQYYTDNQQHDAHYDASHFDPYNTHHLHESNDQERPQEPYQDEPNPGLSQGVSTDPLNHGSKEASSYADEFNANARQGGCVLTSACTSLLRHVYTFLVNVGCLTMCGRGDTSKVALYGNRCVRV